MTPKLAPSPAPMRMQSRHTSFILPACASSPQDQETYEETRLKRDEDWAVFLKEGSVCELMFFNGKVTRNKPICMGKVKICAWGCI